MDVKRKHNLDRRSEYRRVSSVATAPRYGFVRYWRAQLHAQAPLARERKELRADKIANKVSVAIGRQPELFPQARGRLHGEQSVQLKRRTTCRSDRPLKRLLQEYIDEHKDGLEVETALRHSRASKKKKVRRTG